MMETKEEKEEGTKMNEMEDNVVTKKEEEEKETKDDGAKTETKDEEGTKNESKDDIKEEKKEDNDEWLDILDNGQILKKVIKEGNKNYPRPEKGCRVKLNLTTKLKETGELIESECFEGADIFVGDCDIHHALDLIVPLMNIEEVANVVVSPRFAYGEKGKEPEVPSNATLDLTVEIVSGDWLEDLSEIEAQERIKIGERKKERGNFFFARSEYSNSVMLYKRAIEFLEIDPTELGEDVDKAITDKIMELKANTFNNLAQAQMKIEAYDAALTSVNNALAINERNVKALFRKGKILASRGDLQEALEVYRAASKLDPENRLIKIELAQISKQRQKQLSEEKVMFKRMLQLDDDKNDATASSNQNKSCFVKKWYNPKVLITLTSIGAAAISALVYHYYTV